MLCVGPKQPILEGLERCQPAELCCDPRRVLAQGLGLFENGQGGPLLLAEHVPDLIDRVDWTDQEDAQEQAE